MYYSRQRWRRFEKGDFFFKYAFKGRRVRYIMKSRRHTLCDLEFNKTTLAGLRGRWGANTRPTRSAKRAVVQEREDDGEKKKRRRRRRDFLLLSL